MDAVAVRIGALNAGEVWLKFDMSCEVQIHG